MRRKRRKFSAEFKLKVILEALKDRESLSKLAQKFDLHQNQISKWKSDFLATAANHMSGKADEAFKDSEKERKELYAKIGELQMEVDFLKKKLF